MSFLTSLLPLGVPFVVSFQNHICPCMCNGCEASANLKRISMQLQCVEYVTRDVAKYRVFEKEVVTLKLDCETFPIAACHSWPDSTTGMRLRLSCRVQKSIQSRQFDQSHSSPCSARNPNPLTRIIFCSISWDQNSRETETVIKG